jgi:metallo-beta-lactamase family protein
MVDLGRLPKAIQVYLDSPMAISATEIFRRHPESLEPELIAKFRNGSDPLAVPGLHFTREAAESMRINNIRGGAVILAGSGMATGGRVRHHIRHNIWRADSSFVVVGFAAVGTLARIIVDGAKSVRLFGEQIPVYARVYTIGGFSAHAGQTELVAWQRPSGARRTFLVHGEEPPMRVLAGLLKGTEVVMPRMNEAFEL